MEIITSLRFFIEYARGKPHTRGHGHRTAGDEHDKMGFGEAFGVSTSHAVVATSPSSEFVGGGGRARQASYDEHIHLAAYPSYPARGSPPHSPGPEGGRAV